MKKLSRKSQYPHGNNQESWSVFGNIFLTIIFIIPVWCGTAYAGVYYVSPNGGTGTGTINNPWSFDHANANLNPGDTAKLLPGMYTDVLIRPAVSGTSESMRIIYEANDMNNKPEFRSSRRSAPFLIDLTDRNYITINGIRADGKEIYRSSKFNAWVLFDNSRFCIIKNSVFERSKGYSAISFRNGSKYNKILGNVISENGTWDKFPWGGVHDDSGSAMWIGDGSDYNLIQDNLFRRSGHDLGIIEGSYNVIRKNVYDNDWGIYTGPAFTWKSGDIQPGDRVGNRTLSLKKGKGNLVEENIFMNTPESVDNARVSMSTIAGKNQIIRKNIYLNGAYEAMSSTAGSGNDSPINIKIYSNTYYKFEGPIWRFQAYNSENEPPSGNIFKNNITYKSRQAPNNLISSVEFQFLSLSTHYGDQLLSNKITYNCVARNAAASDQKIYAEDTGVKSLSYYESNFPTLIGNNVQMNPEFVSEVSTIDAFDSSSDLFKTALEVRAIVFNALSLKSDSQCINKGGDLTYTTSSGLDSTVIKVLDAGYFSDGFGLISGDEILIGLNSSVRITNINMSTNQVTVDKAISWSSGDPVNLIFSGESPDPGAIENHVTTLPPVELDSDGDSIPDVQDAFPDDPTEWQDTDLDGIGNNIDPDDDNDGLPDDWEIQYGLNPLQSSDATSDLDGDTLSNFEEFNLNTNPTLTDTDVDGVDDNVDFYPTDSTRSHENSNPFAMDDKANTDEGIAMTIDLISNDTDSDDDMLTIASVDNASANSGIIINNGDGTITYTPASNFSGDDNFSYTISDGNGGFDTATVTVTVTSTVTPGEPDNSGDGDGGNENNENGVGSFDLYALLVLLLGGVSRRAVQWRHCNIF